MDSLRERFAGGQRSKRKLRLFAISIEALRYLERLENISNKF